MHRAAVLMVAVIAVGIMTAQRAAGQTKRPSDTVIVDGPIVRSVPPPDIESAFRVRLVDPTEAGILRSALVGAAGRLRRSECQTVLSEFHDKRGRSLADVLVNLTVDPARYLSWL